MIAELGNFSLALALIIALVQTIGPLYGAARKNDVLLGLARPMAALQFAAVSIAFAALMASFLLNDFSVKYVAQHSNLELPIIYRISAVWGAHEGSLLLWLLVQAGWTIAVCLASGNLPKVFAARVISVLGFISVGFLAFTLFTSNPFERLFPVPFDGSDLNPLLQDPGLAIHPPLLYLGYVGFSVAFAFAIAAMLGKEIDSRWVQWARPWTIFAWVFLTLGIALGSWWAYYELGWGGWWFWDPVENASFMPWLVGTALVHSLAVTERRGLFKSWTLLLSVCAFSLSLLGTFLVRSGILVSVHSFASDPARGYFILAFLAVVVGGALVLYSIRAPGLDSDAGFTPLSRELFLLLNNVLLVIAALLVFVGTLYPLILDTLGLGKISVGPPYFEVAFIVPILPLLLLAGFGAHVSWRKTPVSQLRRLLTPAVLLAPLLSVSLLWFVYGGGSLLAFVSTSLALWLMLSAASIPLRVLARVNQQRLPLAAWGMHMAHFGLGVFALGASVASTYSIASDQVMQPGQRIELAGNQFELVGVRNVSGPNYEAREGEIQILKDGELLRVLYPQKRVYRVQRNPMTEAAIDASLWRDWFVALGDPLGAGAWSVRIQYKPMLRLVWLGALIMGLGGALAASDKRYRSFKSGKSREEHVGRPLSERAV